VPSKNYQVGLGYPPLLAHRLPLIITYLFSKLLFDVVDRNVNHNTHFLSAYPEPISTKIERHWANVVGYVDITDLAKLGGVDIISFLQVRTVCACQINDLAACRSFERNMNGGGNSEEYRRTDFDY
jgi:hypothetical protein